MAKFYTKFLFATLLFFVCGSSLMFAETATIKAKTSAPAGTLMRIFCYPYDAKVTGAEPEGVFGMYISQGEGTEITITADNLGELEIYDCGLTELQAVHAPDLYILRCYSNQITSLDLTNCQKLEVLECQNNGITNFDVSHNPLLEKLNVGFNRLESLQIGSQEYLTELKCNDNPLTELNLSECPVLSDLYFENCNLSSLDLSANPKLEWVQAYNNGLAGDKLTAFIETMPEARTTGYIYIVDTRAETESNVCTMEDVRKFAAKGWATMDYLGASGSDTQLGKFYPGCDYVPTISDRKISISTTRQPGEKITLSISSSASFNITGVTESAAAGKLTYTLTSSDIEIIGDITAFECPDNDITSMSFDDPSLLTYIECQNNHIASLNLTGARALKQLYCQDNELTALNLTDCTSLMRVNCYHNRLKGSGMKAFVNSLYNATGEPYLFIIDTKANGETEGNIATTTDVAIAKDKGWEVFDYADGANWGMGVSYDGSEPTEPELPSEYFTVTRSVSDYLIITVVFSDPDYFPVVEGGEILGWNGSGITVNMTEETLKIYGDAVVVQALFSLIEAIDVSNLPNLEELNLALNDVKEIDLSHNPKLTSFSCECNLLTSLDFSNCPAIDYVNCYGNQISGDNMTAMISSLPKRTSAAPGMLLVYDGTYPGEGNVCLKSDVAAAREKYWVTCQLTADDENPVIYEGEDPAGIAEISVSNGLTFDAANAVITTDAPTSIAVFTVAGRPAAHVDNANLLSVAELPKGIYVVRAGGNTLKIVR